MRRDVAPVVIVGCLLALLLTCYGPALFSRRQFAYRDAAHYYYPLYQRVQAEWEAGRWPLWEPEENGGMPLLGNPTAAVLYPGKVIYRVFPYPWAARLYVVAHTVLAFGGMFRLLRSWRASRVGSGIGGLSYAFGAPVLFQYCNIIYLVGAAWLPIGFQGVDRWLRLGKRYGLLELAVALGMQTLGGDPETTYVTGLCAGGYAIGLAWLRGRGENARPRIWPWVLLAVLASFAWTAATLYLAHRLPGMRPEPHKFPPRAFGWMRYASLVVLSIWVVAGWAVVWRWRRLGWRSPLATMLAGLTGAAVLAAALSAAQLLPVAEFTRQSSRAAGEGTHDVYPFSLEPIRLVEFLWPNAFGAQFQGNRNWLAVLPPQDLHGKVWVPSLYLGGLTLVLGLGALGFRHGPPWRAWLTAVAALSLLAALGEYTGPLWWARFIPSCREWVGPHDPIDVTAIRLDAYLRDGDGSFYWALATAVPGFKQFRYPSKLLVFTAFALSGLAGLEWDRLTAGKSRRTAILAAGSLVLSGVVLVLSLVYHGLLLETLERRAGTAASQFGPLEPSEALCESRRALVQGAVMMAIVVCLAIRLRRRPALAGAIAIVVLSVDLALANSKYVVTVPQALLEAKPRVVQLIEDAERSIPSPGPFRVHRTPIWEPYKWMRHSSRDRVRDFVAWERATIQPKYGLPYQIQYTKTLGVAELYDYEWFFGPWLVEPSPEVGRLLNLEPKHQVVAYPRRGFDLWNTRYFVLPFYPGDWKDEHRGIASFLDRSERIFPPRDAFDGLGGQERQRKWIEEEDFQIRRNQSAFPRAWVVHSAKPLRPIVGLDRESRNGPMMEILYDSEDKIWHDPTRSSFDPADVVWIDEEKGLELAHFLPGMPPLSAESVTVSRYEPQRVELEASLERPGLVVLADVYYPGWRLTIDDVPAPLYRANRMMRGAAVESGKHRLVYTFVPISFRIGGWISLASLILFGGLSVIFARRPIATSVLPS